MNAPEPVLKPLHSVLVIAFVLFSGALTARFLGGTTGISRFLFGYVDILGYSVAIMLATISAFLTLVFKRWFSDPRGWNWLLRIRPWQCAVVCLISSVIGVHFVYSSYALSMDEWMPRLQAGIFLNWQLSGVIPEEWQTFGHAMFTHFASYDAETGEVASTYRPGMAALLALFEMCGLSLYVSAILNAASTVIVAIVSRQLMPEAKTAAPMAAILLATSSQALAASLTSYAMTAHLFFNLLWLHFFLRGTLSAHLLAAFIGIFTASLHQVHMHLFFAFPFFFLLLRRRQFGFLLVYILIYLFGHLAIIAWDEVLIKQTIEARPGLSRTTAQIIKEVFSLPSGEALASIWVNLTRLFAWQNLAVLPLLLAFWRVKGTKTHMQRMLLASIFCSLLPYVFFMPDQGHGWGYRYLHGLLGHLSILAAFGWHFLPYHAHRFRNFIVLLIAFSTLVLVPLRAYQIQEFVTPYARATEYVHSRPADAVIVDSFTAFVGQDVPRNDPAEFQPPAVLLLHLLSIEDIRNLCSGRAVEFISGKKLSEFGIISVSPESFPDASARQAYELLVNTIARDCSYKS